MFRFFERLLDPFQELPAAAPPDSLLRFCWYYARPAWRIFALVSILGALLAIAEVAVFSFFGNLIDWLSTSQPDMFLAENQTMLIIMSLVVIVVIPGLSFLWELLFHQSLMGNYPMLVRWLAHRFLLRQSVEFYQSDFAGRIANKVMQTALAVREVTTRILDVLVYVLVYFLSALVLVFTHDIFLALPMACWFLFYVAMMFIFVPPLRKISKLQADARATMTGHVVDAYTNITTVKLFSHTAREELYAKGSMSHFLHTVYRQMRYVTLLNFTLHTINSLLLFAIIAVGIWRWQIGLLTSGEIAVAAALALRLQGMSQWILWEIAGLFENIGTVQDGMGTISRNLEVTDSHNAKPLVVNQGNIEFDRVKFHYGKEHGIIDDLTLQIRAGEKIGLVGPSGAGKSTLINLLLRFHDLEQGRITIDEQDIREATQISLRAHIGVVTQDTALLHRSIRENIAYGQPDAQPVDIINAAKGAKALDFIEECKDKENRCGFDAHVGERGVKLSGGQRQRIAIARVLLKNAPILILDEATSALDSEIEAVIQQSLFKLMEGKTVIAIAHRLSTISAMDRLVVMDRGEIVESGTHNSLVALDGLYARMWRRQSGGFINSAAIA